MQMHRLIIILCFLLQSSSSSLDDDPNHISINCGGAPASTSLNGKQWHGDAAALKLKGSSTTVKRELITAVDPVPYSTARISRSQFSYSFHLATPGQKFIRLHFNPVSYHGFQSDLFTVEAGPFTLLANFSASITARALSLNVVVKEFCIIVQQNQPLNIVFSPETSLSKYNYAFINGVEIISLPSTINYCHGGDNGVDVLGQKSVIYIDNTTVLERVYYQTIKWGSVLDNTDGLFGMWASNLKENANKDSNLSWRVSVDVGFRYLVRIHLCQVGVGVGNKLNFTLLIDDMIALTNADIMPQQGQGGNQSILWYNYMVMVEGHKREGKRAISISLNSQHEFLDKHGPLEGFEVLKLSNLDRSLASPNPLLPGGDSPSHTIQNLLHSLLGRVNAIATLVFTLICLLNIIVHFLNKMWGADINMSIEEENKPSPRVKRLCRSFSLAEIQSATDNFHSGFIIGKGGFGTVYKGFIDNRREIVAIKRLKPDSKQGELQFWTEVETLSELRHVNLVSLIGFCIDQKEMILVYEYMPYGTLADHLYKLERKSKDFCPISWMQRLKICIGACRALDYLHTGHGIIHHDVKASNILLDEKFVAKVSDFGFAKAGCFSESHSQDSTNLKGTVGYIDPNFFKSRKLTKQSDIYSFGVVLLEVLCGRAAVEPCNEEDKRSLTTWAIDSISKGQVDNIVAPTLRGEISTDSLKTFVKVTERCLHDEPKKRPAAAHIVIKLEFALLQQVKAESFAQKEMTSFEDFVSSTDKSQKDKMNLVVPNEKINVDNDVSPGLRNFTFAELWTATWKFGSDSVLGEGGFGKVYKGWLNEKSPGKARSRTPIAVKKLNSESMEGFPVCKSEVNFLGRLSHPNLVRLLGYCYEEKELLLVYEFMPKGSLENHLFGRDASVQPLPWDTRLKILIGAARGLAYLHASDRKVIYREFNASNILLDGSYHAKITDFGLARLGPTDKYGHAAPEYITTGHLYVKSDVHGFGVVLLEMLTGLRALDTNRPSGQHSLVDWMKPHLSGRRKLKRIIDARLEGRYPTKSALEMAQLALTCLESVPKNRPSMQKIVETLERIDSSSERPYS